MSRGSRVEFDILANIVRRASLSMNLSEVSFSPTSTGDRAFHVEEGPVESLREEEFCHTQICLPVPSPPQLVPSFTL